MFIRVSALRTYSAVSSQAPVVVSNAPRSVSLALATTEGATVFSFQIGFVCLRYYSWTCNCSYKCHATRNKCIASSNKCLTSSNKKLLRKTSVGFAVASLDVLLQLILR